MHLTERRKNAQLFSKLFADHPYIQIQKEVGSSSWFGFSMVVKPEAPFTRKDLVAALQAENIECRPIVTGNFLKNEQVLRYFDYEVSGLIEAAEVIDKQGLFVGNHQIPLQDEIERLKRVVDAI